MPAPASLDDRAGLHQRGEQSVKVGGLDPQSRGHFGDRDTWLLGDESERFSGTLPAALRSSRPTLTRSLGRLAGLHRRGRLGRLGRRLGTPRTTWTATLCCGWRSGSGAIGCRDASQRLRGGLQMAVLIDKRLQLREPLVDLVALRLKEIGHGVRSPSVFGCSASLYRMREPVHLPTPQRRAGSAASRDGLAQRELPLVIAGGWRRGRNQ